MKTWQIVALDDIEAAEKRQVPATHTVTVGWQGRTAELDLCDDNYQNVKSMMERLIRAGHEPGEVAAPKGPRSVGHYKAMRAWADKQGRSDEYTKYKSGYRYGDDLRRDFDAHLASLVK